MRLGFGFQVRVEARVVPPAAEVHVLEPLARARGEDDLHAAAAQVDDPHGRHWLGLGLGLELGLANPNPNTYLLTLTRT